jgi:putative transposase
MPALSAGPVGHTADWLRYVNEPQTEVEALRESIRRRRPYGDSGWRERTARRMGLQPSLRPRGRPRKQAD